MSIPNSCPRHKEREFGSVHANIAYNYVVAAERMRVALDTFRAESVAVYEGPIATLHVFDVYLRRTVSMNPYAARRRTDLSSLLPYFRMRPAENLRVEEAITFPGRRLGVGLPPNLDPLAGG